MNGIDAVDAACSSSSSSLRRIFFLITRFLSGLLYFVRVSLFFALLFRTEESGQFARDIALFVKKKL